MEQKSCFREFLRYTTFNILGMLGLSCYILADTFFIANGLGANGLTALNLAIPIYSFIHGCGLMLGMGGATKFAVFRSQNAQQKSDRAFSLTIYLAILFAAAFVLTGIFFTGTITKLLGADAAVFAMTKTYLRVILLFSPAFITNNIFVCFIRNDGNPRLAMFAMLAGSFSNILLDYIFIFPLQMGILGAVLATGFSPIISMCILSRHLIKKQQHFHFRKSSFQPALAVSLLSIGLPSLVTEVSSGIVIIIFNLIILHLRGNIGVAAYGVIANLSLVAASIYTGIAQGMQPLTSRAHGQNNSKNITQIFRYGIGTVLLVSCCLYLIIFFFASPITDIFNSEKNAVLQQIAETGLKLYFTAVPFMGFNIISSMLFSSIEKAWQAQAISLLRGFILIIPMTFFLSKLFDMTGVWLAVPVTEGIVTLLSIILIHFSTRIHRQSHP